jgi:F420-dependent oxidoreductase-like protein
VTTGVVLGARPGAVNVVDDFVDQARGVFAAGIRQVWLSQQFQQDAIMVAALTGAAVPGLEIGTAAVPLNPRPPLIMASLAQTAQAATHGRFSLGLGLGTHAPETQTFGMEWPNPIARLREYLQILKSVFDTGEVNFRGSEFTATPVMPVNVAGGTPLPVYVAAMGRHALRVTGELADGTLPNLAGPRTIENFIRPIITEAAAAAGRPSPHVIVQVPVLPTHHVEAGYAAAAERLAFFESIPSYARVIAREGVDTVADLAAVGSAEAIRRHLQRYYDAGATSVVLNPLDPAALPEVWQIAATLTTND